MKLRHDRRLPKPEFGGMLKAGDRFGKYKKESERETRQLEVRGDELEHLRRKRELLRSMTPEQAFAVIEFHKNLNVFEALALAKKEGKVIVPNDVHDRILTEANDEAFLKNYPVWTGTCVIYEAPDKPFGEKVVYGWEYDVKYSISIAIPQEFMGKKNCALVVEHPDFELVDSGNGSFELKAEERNISLIERFPKESEKWHVPDERFRIPVGEPKREGKSRRYLYRTDEHVGLVARGYSDYGGGGCGSRRDVDLYFEPSGAFGVAVF